jgi:hypothetical protein
MKTKNTIISYFHVGIEETKNGFLKMSTFYFRLDTSFFIKDINNIEDFRLFLDYISNVNKKKSTVNIYTHLLHKNIGILLLEFIVKIMDYKSVNVMSNKSSEVLEINFYYNDFKVRFISINILLSLKMDLEVGKEKSLLNNFNKVFNNVYRFLDKNYGLKLEKFRSASGIGNAIFDKKFNNRLFDNHCKDYNFLKDAQHYPKTIIYKNSGQNLYKYDVNSLYPFVMSKFLPANYIGINYDVKLEDILLSNNQGFYFCEVYRPSITYISLFPKSSEKISSITDYYYGLYYSEEIKLWHKLGYKITKIYYGYEFKKQNFFNHFIEEFYEYKRIGFNKNISRKSNIYKSILNTLYGNIGRRNLIQPTKLGKNDKGDISLYPMITAGYSRLNMSVYCAIISYARMHLLEVIETHKLNLYYIDTDSFVVDKAIPYQYVNHKIGSFKLENFLKNAIFINPGLYAYKNIHNNEIIKTSGKNKDNISFKDFEDHLAGVTKYITNRSTNIKNLKVKVSYRNEEFSKK